MAKKRKKSTSAARSVDDWVDVIKKEVQSGKSLEQVIANNTKGGKSLIPVDAISKYAIEKVEPKATKKRKAGKPVATSSGCNTPHARRSGSLR